jgi:ADP-heptose:LPS heptosyltransferase
MKQEHMRSIDRWVGSALCWGLTVLRRAIERLRPPRAAAPRRIMFIKLIEQGASVLAHDAIKRACAAVGPENVYFCVFTENRAIVDILGIIPRRNVLTLRHARPWQLVADVLRLVVFCRRAGIDATIDMEFFARAPAILAFLTGARIRVGLHRFTAEAPYRGDLMTHRVPHNPYFHAAVAYRSLVDACLAQPGEHRLFAKDLTGAAAELPRFVPTPTERAKVAEIMATALGRPPSEPIVLLNPNAGDLLPIRKWAQERFTELAERLLETYPDATIFVTGAPSERAAADAFAAGIASPRLASLAGRTSLRELFVVYDQSDLLVTNDSGPGHFSTMTDIHALVLFGPETPALFGPLGHNSRALWHRFSCSPCVSAINHRLSPCADNRCMQAITVDEVHEAAVEALAARGYQADRGSARQRAGAWARPAGTGATVDATVDAAVATLDAPSATAPIAAS